MIVSLPSAEKNILINQRAPGSLGVPLALKSLTLTDLNSLI